MEIYPHCGNSSLRPYVYYLSTMQTFKYSCIHFTRPTSGVGAWLHGTVLFFCHPYSLAIDLNLNNTQQSAKHFKHFKIWIHTVKVLVNLSVNTQTLQCTIVATIIISKRLILIVLTLPIKPFPERNKNSRKGKYRRSIGINTSLTFQFERFENQPGKFST